MKLKPVRSATFRGKRYKIVWSIPKRHQIHNEPTLGVCEAPNQKDKAICIQKGTSEIENLSTIIHESLHASYWDHDEDSTQEVADDLARFLWRCGYRPKE